MSTGPAVLGDARRVFRHQRHNLRNALAGRPLTTPSLASATLDHDDVEIAHAWLRDRSQWAGSTTSQQFESEFATWNGSRHAFAFMAGRVALSAAIHALGLGPGDEVIVPGYTCVVVTNAFTFAGVDIKFIDIELETYGLDANRLDQAITPRTRAVLVQHLYGLVCRDYDAILEIAARRGLRVIEDCAHCAGAELNGVRLGNRGDVAFYSSEHSKVFSTVQGGMATTNDEKIAARLAEYRDRAPFPDDDWIERQLYAVGLDYYQYKDPQRWWRGDVALLAHGRRCLMIANVDEELRGIRPAHYGRRMPAPIAAIGLNQLRKVDAYNERRRATARRWDAWCDRSGYQRPLVVEGSTPVFLRYPVLVEPERKRDTTWAMKDPGVLLGVWFLTHTHPVPGIVEGCPNADEAVSRCVNLPCLID
jgi:dTDP-4-amino-4,6-dideoxygalactose transaminase